MQYRLIFGKGSLPLVSSGRLKQTGVALVQISSAVDGVALRKFRLHLKAVLLRKWSKKAISEYVENAL